MKKNEKKRNQVIKNELYRNLKTPMNDVVINRVPEPTNHSRNEVSRELSSTALQDDFYIVHLHYAALYLSAIPLDLCGCFKMQADRQAIPKIRTI